MAARKRDDAIREDEEKILLGEEWEREKRRAEMKKRYECLASVGEYKQPTKILYEPK